MHPLPVLITCHHVLKKEEIKKLKEIVLTFKKNKKLIKFDKPRKIYESDNNHHDCIIIELKENEFDIDDLLDIDDDIFKKGDLKNIKIKQFILFIIQKEMKFNLLMM